MLAHGYVIDAYVDYENLHFNVPLMQPGLRLPQQQSLSSRKLSEIRAQKRRLPSQRSL